MRGDDRQQGSMFSCVDLEARVPEDHPLRPMRAMVDGAPGSMLGELPGDRRITLGADKGYDTFDFIEGCRALNVTPHVAQNESNRSSRIDERTTRHEGFAVSQRRRKQIEGVFGWMKTIGGVRKVLLRGREKVDWIFTLTAAVYDVTRIRTLCSE